ncbi:oligosaccharide flippase family protein [Pseudomonas xanthosomatis]|uniref:oligosaccharide flippase family protein n=1 Tax=Pseudomonas xanthosomatis TaxID=2842356 RepID=UPI001C3E2848|nr:oligosaccharide flippase family protein [Pseudomonas xanthosomatis]QXH48307.1 oligosaccharide flippase family protein [Pseudomonas xanthosomatis]
MKFGVLGSNVVIYFLSNVANALVPFICLPVLTRVLGPLEYGYVAAFTILCACATALISLGVGGAFTRQFYHLDQAKFAEFAGTAVLLIAALTLVGALSFHLLSPLLDGRLPLPATWISGAIISAGALAICNAWLACAQVRSRALSYGAFQVSMTLVNISLSLLLVLYFNLQGAGRVVGQVAAFCLFAAVAVFSLWRSGWLVFTVKRTHLHWLLMFGIPIIPHSISGVVIAMSDRMVLGHVAGPAVLGVYAVSAQLAMAMALIVDSVNKAYVPWLYSRLALDQQAIRRQLVRISYLYFAGVLCLAALLSLVVPPFIGLIAGAQFVEAEQYQAWLFFSGACTGMYYMVGLYINYAARNKYLSFASGLAALVTPVFCYLLVAWNGPVGAAQGALLGQGVLFLATWYFSMRAYPMPWFKKDA